MRDCTQRSSLLFPNGDDVAFDKQHAVVTFERLTDLSGKIVALMYGSC